MRASTGRSFYAVGGTWRALARLHMAARGYPLHVMHGYQSHRRTASTSSGSWNAPMPGTLKDIESVAEARRPLLAYGAVVLDEIIRAGKPKVVEISALGVREGFLFERLDAAERSSDPLIAAAGELNALRSRSPAHGDELQAWTGTSSPAPASTRPAPSAGCARRPACSPTWAGGRIPTIGASRAST